jgi:hypothetical protein
MWTMWNLTKKKRWSERRTDGRTPDPDLDASYSTEVEQKKVRVKDISAGGMYLLTEDRFQPGTGVDLTLQKSGKTSEEALLDSPEVATRSKVNLRARAVRVGDDGVGVVFEPGSTDSATWSRLMAAVQNLSADVDRLRLMRMTKALAFVVRISPGAESEMLRIITNNMSLERAGRAIDMALKAEELATAQQTPIRNDLPAELVLRILEDGSKVDEEHTRHLWSMLLATSTYEGSNDETNLNYAILLSRIDAVQMRVFEFACKLAFRVGWDPEFKFHRDLHCSADDIRKISHIQNMMGIERDLNHMHEHGLLERTDRPIMCQEVERVNLTPTALALRLYARCHGMPEPPVSCPGAVLSKAS